MLRRIEDMPAGTIGFEATGEVEGDALGADARFRDSDLAAAKAWLAAD